MTGARFWSARRCWSRRCCAAPVGRADDRRQVRAVVGRRTYRRECRRAGRGRPDHPGVVEAPPANATVIDLSRYTGLPGSSTRTRTSPTTGTARPARGRGGQRRTPAETVFLAQDNAIRTLQTGVTTVRDLNAGNDMDFAMRDLVARGTMIGPRIFASGPGLSARQGAAPNPEAMRAAGRRSRQGGRGLDQGLRLARRLRQRRWHADGDVRRNARGGRARPSTRAAAWRFIPTARRA